jgi:cation transport ATPase
MTSTAQIVLMNQRLNLISELFDMANYLKVNMNSNIVISVISSAVTVGGVYFLHVGVIGSLLINNLGLAAGVANATLPLLKSSDRQ